MSLDWFRTRGYRHFDVPVNRVYAGKVMQPGFAAAHSFSPFLHFTKETKRYRPRATPGKVEVKARPIMYASHRDACLFSYYSALAAMKLEEWYVREGLSDNVIAYRRLGKANYHFSAEAVTYARQHAPCTVLAFDVSQFFDSLDHAILKDRLKEVLEVSSLSEDWYAVFRNITRYRYVKLESLKANPILGPSLKPPSHPLVDLRRIKPAGISIEKNPDPHGIPQGSPISSTLANLYMGAFDKTVARWCREAGAFYRRYSDDILVICDPVDAVEAERLVMAAIAADKLSINPAKTDRTLISAASEESAQYLGFSLRYGGASIRPSSMSRQWRKLRRAAKRIEKAGRAAVASGKASKIYTRKLRRRFSPLKVRNFSAYARRSGDTFSSKAIRKQARRLERELDRIIEGFA